MGKFLLGIDNGGTVTKAGLYDATGKELAIATKKTEMIFPEPGFTERDSEAMWEANIQAIAEVIHHSGVSPNDIAGVAVTGHGNGMYLTQADGTPAYNGIISTDSRAADFVSTYYRDGTFDKVLPKTCQSIWAAQPAALLPWFKKYRPEVLEKTRWVFMCKDFIRFRLTGEAHAEVTDYSGTSLMNVHTVEYDRELLTTFDVADLEDRLPPIRGSAEACGNVQEDVAKRTGLVAGTPVFGGLFDIDACALSTGVTDPEKLCIVAGTWSINEYISTEPVESRSLFMSSKYCMPGYWLITEASPTSASNLEWFVTQLMSDTQSATEEKSPYEKANELVNSIHPDESSVIFLPFLYGSNVGGNASAGFLGLKGWHTLAHMLRALYEGVVFSHMTHIERLFELRERPRSVRIAGGAARSQVWVQMFADALQMPIEVAETEEFGALGAAICAGVGAGMFESYEEATSKMVKISQIIQPNTDLGAIYQRKYEEYKKTIGTMQELWDG